MKINRESLLQTLEQVLPGINTKGTIEQSDSFVFTKGYILTYNDEVACKVKSPFGKEVQGAVPSDLLLNLLRKLTEDELEFTQTDSELLLSGKRRRAGIRTEKEVVLPIGSVDEPGEWKALHEDFVEAISLVNTCAGQDQSRFALTCVHIHPKWVEATDDFQVCRWKIKTGLSKPTLVRQASIKHIVSLGVSELGETESWLHFRSPSGLVFSCRRFTEDYPEMTPLLEVQGHPLTIPKALDEAVSRAETVVTESVGGKQVKVSLSGSKLKVSGQGPSGWFSETKKVSYQGPAISFLISPAILSDLSRKHSECIIGTDKLKASGGKYIYISCLGLEDAAQPTGGESE